MKITTKRKTTTKKRKEEKRKKSGGGEGSEDPLPLECANSQKFELVFTLSPFLQFSRIPESSSLRSFQCKN